MSDSKSKRGASQTQSGDAGEVKLNPVEKIKAASTYLRGTISDDLSPEVESFSKDNLQLLKHHGMYQQDNRDVRAALRASGCKDKSYSVMLRTRLPGGRISAEQMLTELQIGDLFGDNTIRLTTRQAIQHHGIVKSNLREVMQRINDAKMTTLAACGDVNRNIMFCPAPLKTPIQETLERLTNEMAERLSPRTKAYYELWLKDPETGDKELAGGAPESEIIEPLYGKTYLPRKFKMAFGYCHDNCIDIYTHDLGMLAVIRDDRLIGFNVLVGGGMGTTPAKKETYPAIAKRMSFIPVEQVFDVAEAVVKVQRDHGNRADRKLARMKYLVDRWGIDRFKSTVDEYLGETMAAPEPDEVHGFDDHMGWLEQGDGRWAYGLNIENGRIKDDDQTQLKTAIYEVCRNFKTEMRVTSHQSLLFTDIEPDAKSELEGLLKAHNVQLSEDYSTVRRWSMACVAWPTCGLAITESERALPSVLTDLERELIRLGLDTEKFTVRMTGCPNGCARPYNADVGLVGKAKDRYTMFLGGRLLGNRLGFIYQDLVPRDQIVPELVKVFGQFKLQRQPGETFGDFCHRYGVDGLRAMCDKAAEAA